MDDTPNLGLPYIMAAQSQKHVTHNEAIRALDAMVQLAVLDRDLAAPPVSPADGARYIVGSSPTGAWSGHAAEVAAYQDGAWMLYAPVEGWIAWIGDEDIAVVWDGTTWSALTTGSGGGAGSFTTLGINATADTTNRLTLAADSTLLNHDGDGHQLKINKASASDTASLLYQNAFSGRAELGLAGDDDFHFKVSPDGTGWKEAIVIDRSTGVVTFPFTLLGREVLTANRTYYVRTDGSDSNTGLANTAGGAFLTLQKAADVVLALDLSIFNVTINVADGTYTSGVTVGQLTGKGTATFVGNTTTPANCIVSTTSQTAFRVPGVSGWAARGFKTQTTASGHHILVDGPCVFNFYEWDFGATAASHAHVEAINGGDIRFNSNYTISGGAAYHWLSDYGGFIGRISFTTITLSGTPAFSSAFAGAYRRGGMFIPNQTFSGSATGKRYDTAQLAYVHSFGAGATYLPGDVSGTADAATFALYI